MSRAVAYVYAGIGQRVRELREAQEIKQADLAGAAGLTRTSITNLEAGRQEVPLPALIRIAEHLRVGLAVLVGEAPMPALPARVHVERRYVVVCEEHGPVAEHVTDEAAAEQLRGEHHRQHVAALAGGAP